LVRNAALALAGAFLMSGCAATGTANVDPGYRPERNGVLVASVTASGYLPGALLLHVVRRDAPSFHVASIPVNDSAFGIDWPDGDPAVRNGSRGRLAVIELPPGEYQLRGLAINRPSAPPYEAKNAPGYDFSIAAGKATYLGGVHVDVQPSAALRKLPLATSLEDRRERDLPLLHRRYPGVLPAAVILTQ
jgi:hypothetical protein